MWLMEAEEEEVGVGVAEAVKVVVVAGAAALDEEEGEERVAEDRVEVPTMKGVGKDEVTVLPTRQ